MTRILIIEDEESYRDATAYMLQREGFDVSQAGDGAAGLAEFERNGADLVLLDLMMPDLDGMELLKLLRLDPKGANVPVLVVSARSGHQDQLGTLQLGANAYICKPFSPRELVRQVRQLLETSEAETVT